MGWLLEWTQDCFVVLGKLRQQEKAQEKKSWVIKSLFHGLHCLCNADGQRENRVHMASSWGRWAPPALREAGWRGSLSSCTLWEQFFWLWGSPKPDPDSLNFYHECGQSDGSTDITSVTVDISG